MIRAAVLIALALLASWPARAQAPDAADPGGFVVVCPIDGEINDGVAVVVERAVREAEGAAGIVFVIDTPGGRVDSAINITKSMLAAPCPTVAFVTGMGAISAGALISYACDDIIMAPTSNFGASTPIMPGMETTPAMDEKSNSFVRAKYRALGEVKGHDPLLGEAMVDAGIELHGYTDADGIYRIVKTDEAAPAPASANAPQTPAAPGTADLERVVRGLLGKPEPPAPDGSGTTPEAATETATEAPTAVVQPGMELVSAKGSLLTLTPNEALKVGLTPHLADDLDAALAYKGWGELRQVKVTPNWDEYLFAFLTSPTIAGLLLMCGIAGLYVEIRTPGFGVPGLVGLLCLAVFFGSHLVVGMADWIDLLIVGVGIVLIALELFVIPGFGIVGVSGIACLMVGCYMALTRVTFPTYAWDFSRLEDAGQTVTTAVLLLTVFTIATWRILPRTALWRSLINTTEQEVLAGYTVQSPDLAHATVGMRGVATSMLRPAGRARFEGKTLDVMTRGEFIAEGTLLQIILVDGNRTVVGAIAKEHQA